MISNIIFKNLFLRFCIFLSAWLLAVSASADIAAWKVPSKQTKRIDAHGVCRHVYNNISPVKDLIVATNNLTEWNAFISSPPTGVTVSACGTVCVCPNGQTESIGTSCNGGGLCAGTFSGRRYMITPSGCTDVASPTCGGGADTFTKTWRGTTGSDASTGAEVIALAGTVATKTGYFNTYHIVANASISANSAANYCDNMTYGGYSDWYLPSKTELTYIFCNSNVSGNASASYPQEQPNCGGTYGNSTVFAGYSASGYWSSTEISSSTAWIVHFNTGNNMTAAKSGTHRVRCIRQY